MKHQNKNKVLGSCQPHEIGTFTTANMVIPVLQPNSTRVDPGNSNKGSEQDIGAPQFTRHAGYWLQICFMNMYLLSGTKEFCSGKTCG